MQLETKKIKKMFFLDRSVQVWAKIKKMFFVDRSVQYQSIFDTKNRNLLDSAKTSHSFVNRNE